MSLSQIRQMESVLSGNAKQMCESQDPEREQQKSKEKSFCKPHVDSTPIMDSQKIRSHNRPITQLGICGFGLLSVCWSNLLLPITLTWRVWFWPSQPLFCWCIFPSFFLCWLSADWIGVNVLVPGWCLDPQYHDLWWVNDHGRHAVHRLHLQPLRHQHRQVSIPGAENEDHLDCGNIW